MRARPVSNWQRTWRRGGQIYAFSFGRRSWSSCTRGLFEQLKLQPRKRGRSTRSAAAFWRAISWRQPHGEGQPWTAAIEPLGTVGVRRSCWPVRHPTRTPQPVLTLFDYETMERSLPDTLFARSTNSSRPHSQCVDPRSNPESARRA